MLAKGGDGGGQILGPDANVAESDGTLSGGGGQFQESVLIDLQISERGLARGVLDGERFLEAHGLRVEAHGLVVILGVDSDVVQAQAWVPILLSGFILLSFAGLHQEASNNDSCCK